MDPGWNAVVYTSLNDAFMDLPSFTHKPEAPRLPCSHPLSDLFERATDGRVIVIETDKPSLGGDLYIYSVEGVDACALLDGVVVQGAANITALIRAADAPLPVSAHVRVHDGRYTGFLLNEAGRHARFHPFVNYMRTTKNIAWEVLTSISTDRHAYSWEYPTLVGIVNPFRVPDWSLHLVLSYSERERQCVVCPKVPTSYFSQVEARALLRIFPDAVAVANVHLTSFESCILTHVADDVGVIPSWLVNELGFGIGPCCYALPSLTPWFPLLMSEPGVDIKTKVFLGRRPVGTVRFIGTVLSTPLANAYYAALDDPARPCGCCVFNGAPVSRGGAPSSLSIQLGSMDTGIERLQLLEGVAVAVPSWLASFRFLVVPEVGVATGEAGVAADS